VAGCDGRLSRRCCRRCCGAESTFRQIQVAFGQRGGGGGGGGGGSAGRDLASLFDLEMDTEKNQYETGADGLLQRSSRRRRWTMRSPNWMPLAKRQEELAQQQGKQAADFPRSAGSRRCCDARAEQLQRDMEQMKGQQQGPGERQRATGTTGANKGNKASRGRVGNPVSRARRGRDRLPDRKGGSQSASRGNFRESGWKCGSAS